MKRDEDRTKEQLMDELAELRQHTAKSKKAETERKQAEQAVRQSEQEKEAILESMSELVVYQDTQHRILWANRTAAQSVGLAVKELTGRHCYEVWPERTNPCPGCPVVKARETHCPEEAEITTPDGRIWFIRGYPIADANANIVAAVEVTSEITQRKQSEEALLVERAKLTSILDAMEDGVYIVNQRYDIEYVNPSLQAQFGPVSGHKCYQYFHDLQDVCAWCQNKAVFAGQTVRWEWYSFKNQRTYDLIDTPLKNADGTISKLEIFRDITERKQAEEALRQSEERYRTILDEMEDNYFEVDLAGNFTFVNDSLCRTFRCSREEVLGRSYRIYAVQEDADRLDQDFNKVYRTGQPGKGLCYSFVAKDGWIGFGEVAVTPLRNPEGQIIGFRGIGRDITERKWAEDERKELERKAHLASRLASVGEMASGIAHEINNPLTGVIGYAQLLMERDIPQDIKADLQVIHDGAQRVAGIVKRLLTFAGQQKPGLEYVNINDIIETTLALRTYELETSNIKVATYLDPQLPQTIGDGGQLQQVFLNLMINAEAEMKLAHGKGNLLIKTETVDNIIRISFEDDGPGMKKETLERIFEPFFTTREVGQGTGLGLSVCHGIVAEHGGTITVESQLRKGATFIVELPLVTKAEQLKLAEPDAEESVSAAGGRILVVDDEPTILSFLSEALTDEGYEVETVDNASDALEKVKNERYSLILLDIKMPGMSGSELYRRIQKIARSLARRVVFITGDVIGASTTAFLSRTKTPYIAKPFDAEELKRYINRILAERP